MDAFSVLLCLFSLQIVGFVNNLLSHSGASNLLFPLESECHCSLEVHVCAITKHKSDPSYVFVGGQADVAKFKFC